MRSCFRLSDASVVALAESCPGLKAVDLSRDSTGLLEWSELRKYSRFTDKSIIALAKNCPKLEWVSIDGCRSITWQAVIELIKSAKNLKFLVFAEKTYDVGDINEIRIRHQSPEISAQHAPAH